MANSLKMLYLSPHVDFSQTYIFSQTSIKIMTTLKKKNHDHLLSYKANRVIFLSIKIKLCALSTGSVLDFLLYYLYHLWCPS